MVDLYNIRWDYMIYIYEGYSGVQFVEFMSELKGLD